MESYNHLSYSSSKHTSAQYLGRNMSEYSDVSLPEDSIYEHITRAQGRNGNTTADQYSSTSSDKTKERNQISKCLLLSTPSIVALIIAILITCVAIGITLQVTQKQLFLKDDFQKLNETIQVYLSEEIEKLDIDKLSNEISRLDQSFKDIQNTLNNTLFNVEVLLATSLLHSCAAIFQKNPFSPSGYYYIYTSSSTHKRRLKVYCDMTEKCGDCTSRGWMRVIELNISKPSSQCPPGLCLNSGILRTCNICGKSKGGCSSDTFPVGVSYSRVCGRVLGYQVGYSDAFEQNKIGSIKRYDGIDLTHGDPKKQIWTFVAARSEIYNRPQSVCPCINPDDTSILKPPKFVGSNYFCDTGSIHTPSLGQFFSNNTLWDGMGCSNRNQCCSFNRPPWFFRQLPHPTTDDIEMSVCRSGSQRREDIAIETIDIYVQ